MIATCGEDKFAKLWDPASGRCIATLSGHEDRVWALAFSPNGRCLATGGVDTSIRLWDIASETVTAATSDAAGAAAAGAEEASEGKAASATGTGRAAATCTASLSAMAVLAGHTGRVRSLAFDPADSRGRRLVSGSDDGSIKASGN